MDMVDGQEGREALRLFCWSGACASCRYIEAWSRSWKRGCLTRFLSKRSPIPWSIKFSLACVQIMPSCVSIPCWICFDECSSLSILSFCIYVSTFQLIESVQCKADWPQWRVWPSLVGDQPERCVYTTSQPTLSECSPIQIETLARDRLQVWWGST